MKKKRTGRGSTPWFLPRKMLIFMKLLGVILLGMCMSIHANVLSQHVKVNLKMERGSLNEVLMEIRKQTKVDFIFNYDLISGKEVEKMDISEKELIQVLEELLPPLGLEFTFDKQIVVIREQQQTQPQRQTLKGRVVDSDNLPLPGVTVVIKGTTRGGTTGSNGEYTIPAPERGSVLVFSFVGMQVQEIVYNGQAEINVVMKESVTEVEEVVVTGIFTRRASTFTGATQKFDQEELRRVGNTNVLQSIKNLDPSFRIQESLANGSDPNQRYEITLRGQSGFPDLKGEYTSNPNEPLFIVDGFEQSLTYVMDMNMDRIASVTLLKDAAAKAIYGSKAANGVVVIETMLPEKGQMRMTYTGNLNVQLPDLTSYNLTNAAEKLQLEYNAGMFTYFGDNGVNITTNPSSQYTYDLAYNYLLSEVLAGVNTDWKAIPLRNGIGQKHTVYLEGGDDFFRYGLDFSYNNVAGVMKGSDRNTFAGGITLSYRHNNLTVRNNLTVTYNKANNSPYGSFSEYTRMNPYYRCHDESGNIIKVPGTGFSRGDVYNPTWNASINTKGFSEYTQLVESFYVEWTPIRGAKLTGRVSLNKTDNGAEVFLPASHTTFTSWTSDELFYRRGSYTYTDGKSFSLSTDLLANYSTQLGEKHMIFANAGWSTSQSTSESATFVAEGFSNDKLDNLAFARQYYENGRPSVSESTSRDIGFVGAMNYSYADRYLFDASFRFSGSSQFGSNNRWGKFWSLGAGWNIHEETFMKNVVDPGWITQLKLRGSLGYTGSQNFSSYQAQATYTYNTSDAYYKNLGAILTAMPNERLKWQRKYDKNIGLDLVLLHNALSIRLDYYQANTDDLLTDVTTPSSTGFTSYKENLGKVENKGTEFNIRYRVWQNTKNQSFLNVFVNGAQNKNRIKQISNYLQSFNDTQTATVSNKPVVRYAEGQSMSSIWTALSYGIDPASGSELFIKPDGTRTYTWHSDYLTICGDTEPDLQGNFGVNFDYKGFSLNVTCRYQFGGQVYNQTLVDKVENADLNYNVDRRIYTDRWVKQGDVSLYKNIRNNTTTRATSRFVEDDNQFSISALNVSYDLNRIPAIKKAKLDRLKLSFDMADFGRIQSVKIERGTSYPFARNFSFSLQAMF